LGEFYGSSLFVSGVRIRKCRDVRHATTILLGHESNALRILVRHLHIRACA
jgi:hypothetical protein